MSERHSKTIGEMAQQPLPFALIKGEVLVEKPQDLFIPPDALEVILDAFEGPLDLLLYLIKKQKFDILDLPIAPITEQYMQYVDLMKSVKLELASEYLVMAAILAEIKSRLLLPKQHVEEEEQDPRAELIRRLQEYEVFKKAANNLDDIPRVERDIHLAQASFAKGSSITSLHCDVDLKDLVNALQGVLKRTKAFEHHHIQKERLSTRERMSKILALLKEQQATEFLPFEHFFTPAEGRSGVVVTFLAILELIKDGMLNVIQNEAFGRINIRLVDEVDFA